MPPSFLRKQLEMPNLVAQREHRTEGNPRQRDRDNRLGRRPHPRLRPTTLRHALRTESELAGKHELVEVRRGHDQVGDELLGQL